jgi:hypothetical protein
LLIQTAKMKYKISSNHFNWTIHLIASAVAYCVLAGCAAPHAALAGITSPIDLHSQIQQVYNFKPHTLDEAQLNEKSAQLDQFWQAAKQTPAAYAAALRKELSDFSNPPFFLFDGSRLLLSLSEQPLDRPIILAAVAHCDPRDVQPINYLWLVHAMAIQNQDTTAAAFHILENPKFAVFVPQHALTLGQDFSLIYMLFPASSELWLGKTIDRLRHETDETAQKSLLLVLWYAQTPESDKAITNFSQNGKNLQATRTYANELLRKSTQLTTLLPLPTDQTSEQTLRQTRQERMKSISDESLLDFDRSTARIIARRKQHSR